jgi:hypothetical protein
MRVRCFHHRRYTRNHTWHLDVGDRSLFLKANPDQGEARQEVVGHAAISELFPVPELRWGGRIMGWTVHVYDRAPQVDDGSLLVDAIAAAEAGGSIDQLDRFLDDVLDHYCRRLQDGARVVPADQTVGKLYRDRATAGGRLDQYYATRPVWELPTGLHRVNGSRLVVNGEERRFNLNEAVTQLRQELFDPPAWAAITQGDPTDFNVAWSPTSGAVWFDYDTGGLNAIAGEIACFLTYQHLHGRWLTPKYAPSAYIGHSGALRNAMQNPPTICVAKSNGATSIDFDLALSSVRRHVIERYVDEVVQPVAEHLGVDDIAEWLRPYVLMRVLAVFNATDLDPLDTALSLGLAAEVADESADCPILNLHGTRRLGETR